MAGPNPEVPGKGPLTVKNQYEYDVRGKQASLDDQLTAGYNLAKFNRPGGDANSVCEYAIPHSEAGSPVSTAPAVRRGGAGQMVYSSDDVHSMERRYESAPANIRNTQRGSARLTGRLKER